MKGNVLKAIGVLSIILLAVVVGVVLNRQGLLTKELITSADTEAVEAAVEDAQIIIVDKVLALVTLVGFIGAAVGEVNKLLVSAWNGIKKLFGGG